MIDSYVELVRGECLYEPFVRWSFLSYISACMGRRVYLRMGARYEYPTTYTMLVGPPSSKKTSSASLPKDLFFRHQTNRPHMAADVLTPASWFKELEDAEKEIGKPDNHAPLFILSKEFSTVLNDIGGGSPLAVLLSFYDNRVPGETYKKRTIHDGVAEIKNPAVTILGCTTPDSLYSSEVLKAGNTGLISRFIIVVQPKFVRGKYRSPRIDENRCLEFAANLDRIAELRGEMTMSPEAWEYGEAIFNEIAEKAETGLLTMAQEEYYGRKTSQVHKVGMLFTAMRHSMRVEKKDLEQAYAMVTATEKNLDFLFAPKVMHNDANLGRKIEIILSRTGGIVDEATLFQQLNAEGIQPISSFFQQVLQSLERSGKIGIERHENRTLYTKKT